MTDEPQNLILEYRRRLDRKVDGLIEDFRHFNLRVASTEGHIAAQHVGNVQQAGEIERIKLRLDRVEKRLELTD